MKILSGEYTFKNQANNNLYKTLDFGVSIPIFNKLQIKNSISNSKLQVYDTKYQLEIAKMALYKEVQQAYADASAAQEKYYSSTEAVKYNEEAFKYTSQKLEVGLVNSVDYNIAQNNLISANQACCRQNTNIFSSLRSLTYIWGNQLCCNNGVM